MRAMNRGFKLCLLLAWLACTSLWAQESEPAATPFRPTVASGAAISLPGWLELELGGQRLGGHGADRRGSLPYLLKYSVNEQLALLLGGDARVSSRPAGGPTLSGMGDTALTLKWRGTAAPAGTSYGVEASVKFPTAATGLGSGERDLGLKGIYGLDIAEGWHLDGNLLVNRLGGIEAGQGRLQSAWAMALSHSVGPAWTLAADLSGTHQRGVADTVQLLGAASYALSPRLVLDGGLARGLNRNTPKWTLFAGMTVLLGQLH